MQLTEEEQYALCSAMGVQAPSETQLQQLDVLERNRTGVGFFATIKLPSPLPDTQVGHYWECNFSHQEMPYGGCFMVSYFSPEIIELEAVAYESDWPEPFECEYFSI